MVHSPKIGRLKDDGINPQPGEAKLARLVKLWCLACENGGVLPSVTDAAFILRMTEEEVQRTLDALKAEGWLDESPDGLTPHNWQEHQRASDSSTDRVREYRERKRYTKQGETVSETGDGVSSETGTKRSMPVSVTVQNRTEEKQRRGEENIVPFLRSSSRASSPLVDRFQEIAARYPNPTGVDAAARQWISVLDTGEIHEGNVEEVFSGLDRWLVSATAKEDGGKFMPSLKRWMEERMWKDAPRPAEVERPLKISSEGNDPYAIWVPAQKGADAA
jgi:hypothetical protein